MLASLALAVAIVTGPPGAPAEREASARVPKIVSCPRTPPYCRPIGRVLGANVFVMARLTLVEPGQLPDEEPFDVEASP